MKICFLLAIVLVMYSSGCCKESDNDGLNSPDTNKLEDSPTNLTSEDDTSEPNNLFTSFMRPQKFTAGTLLGLLVATLVVVVGSFLVLWKVCCESEMRVSRECMEPLKSISQSVGQSGRSLSGEALLGSQCSSSGIEIA